MNSELIFIIIILLVATGAGVYLLFFMDDEENVDCSNVQTTDTYYDENALTYTYDSTLEECVPSTCKYNYEVDSTNKTCTLKPYIDGPVFSATGIPTVPQIGLYDNGIFGYALKYPDTDYITSENEILFSLLLYQPNMTYHQSSYSNPQSEGVGEKFGALSLVFPSVTSSDIHYVSIYTSPSQWEQFYSSWQKSSNNTIRFHDWILEKIPNTEYYYLKTGTRVWVSGSDHPHDENRPRGKYVYYHVDSTDILNNGFAFDTTDSGKKSKFRIDTVDESVAKQVLSQTQIDNIEFHETLPKFFRLVMVITNPVCQEDEVYKFDINECVTEDRTSNDIKDELNSPPDGYSFVYNKNPIASTCDMLTTNEYKLEIPDTEVTVGPNVDTLSGGDQNYGADLGKLTIDECGTLCNSNAQCVGFTYHLGSSQADTDGTCFLRKTAIKPTNYTATQSDIVSKACLAKNTHIEKNRLTDSDGSYIFPS